MPSVIQLSPFFAKTSKGPFLHPLTCCRRVNLRDRNMNIRKPYLLKILFDGFAKLESWWVDGPHPHLVLRSSDSVAILLHDVVNHRFLLVKQSRVAMIREDNPDGLITELIAGRFDVNLTPIELAIKESFEEAGAKILASQVELLNHGQPMALSAGISTERSWIAYAAITPDQLSGTDEAMFGLEEEGERIQRVWISESDLDTFVAEDVRVLALVQHMLNKRLSNELEYGLTPIT